MRVIERQLNGLILLEPKVLGDDRGFFLETWNSQRYHEFGLPLQFVQDNLSRSRAGVLRGLHYQIEQPQGKLVQVLRGAIYDVAVDLRRGSPTFGRWFGAMLSEENRRQMYIPPGFAHGFCVQSDLADVFYKCTAGYLPSAERTVLWNDPQIGIRWPIPDEPILSTKDQQGKPFAEAETFA